MLPLVLLPVKVLSVMVRVPRLAILPPVPAALLLEKMLLVMLMIPLKLNTAAVLRAIAGEGAVGDGDGAAVFVVDSAAEMWSAIVGEYAVGDREAAAVVVVAAPPRASVSGY